MTKEGNVRKYIITDITYCARDCANKKCKRNKKHVENYNGFLSWAYFQECPEWEEIINNNNKK